MNYLTIAYVKKILQRSFASEGLPCSFRVQWLGPKNVCRDGQTCRSAFATATLVGTARIVPPGCGVVVTVYDKGAARVLGGVRDPRR